MTAHRDSRCVPAFERSGRAKAALAALQQVDKLPEASHGAGESLLIEGYKELLRRAGRVLERFALAFHRATYHRGGQIEEVYDELVRVLGLDPEGLQDYGREVAQVERDNHPGVAPDGRG